MRNRAKVEIKVARKKIGELYIPLAAMDEFIRLVGEWIKINEKPLKYIPRGEMVDLEISVPEVEVWNLIDLKTKIHKSAKSSVKELLATFRSFLLWID